MGRGAHRKTASPGRRIVTAGAGLVLAVGIWYGVAGQSELSSGPLSSPATLGRSATTTTRPHATTNTPAPTTTTTRPPATTTTPAPTTTTTRPPATTTTPPPATTSTPGERLPTVGTFRVATARLTLIEGGPTPQPLPTTVWYPEGKGEHPLLVFSQGFWEPVSAYQVLLRDWASAGFVVAAPTYPHTDPPPHPYTRSTPTGTNIRDADDIVNHPAELRFVIQSVLADADEPDNVLFGRVDATEVGVVGHSDGGDVSLAVAADSADFTPKVKAVAVLSGAELPNFFGGEYFTPKLPSVPLLAVQSRTDVVNYPSCSVQLYDGAPEPKWYLQLSGVSHLAGYTTAPSRTVVAKVVARFFTAELTNRPSAMTGISSVADTTFSSISDATVAPAQPGPSACDETP